MKEREAKESRYTQVRKKEETRGREMKDWLEMKKTEALLKEKNTWKRSKKGDTERY